mgnify:CR=1 FL=1|jgi:hypothetical protein
MRRKAKVFADWDFNTDFVEDIEISPICDAAGHLPLTSRRQGLQSRANKVVTPSDAKWQKRQKWIEPRFPNCDFPAILLA